MIIFLKIYQLVLQKEQRRFKLYQKIWNPYLLLGLKNIKAKLIALLPTLLGTLDSMVQYQKAQ